MSFLRSKRLWGRIALACILLLYGWVLAFFCEAAAQRTMDDISFFMAGKNAAAILGNVGLLLGLAILAVTFLTTRLSVGVGLVSIPALAFHIISGVKLSLRGEPLYPADLSLAKEAMSISSSVEIVLTGAMIAAIVLVVLALGGAICADIFLRKKLKVRYRWSLGAGAACILLIIITFSTLFSPGYCKAKGLTVEIWEQQEAYTRGGLVYSFLSLYRSTRVEAPQGYGESAMLTLLDQAKEAREPVLAETPNIIILMSEAFTDIDASEALTFAEPLTPRLNALQAQYLSGRAMTREFGGGTANSEFEVLTGYSANYLPSGAVAYVNYVNKPFNSYASFLRDQGYYTVAVHPHIREFFSRDTAYPMLGFEDFFDREIFQGAELVREGRQFISDNALTDKIIALYEENKASGRPFFAHAVSMQNHSSYTAGEYPEEQQIPFESRADLSDEERGAIASYAAGIHLSDEALGRLVDYFAAAEEPTVILFFGDHMPSIVPGDTYEFLERIGYIDDRYSPEGIFRLFSTPYMIWNNFEAQPTHKEQDLSMFQLLPFMTETLRLERPLLHDYLYSLTGYFWGVIPYGALDGTGTPVKQLTGEAAEKAKEYWMVMYDGMFGKGYVSEKMGSS